MIENLKLMKQGKIFILVATLILVVSGCSKESAEEKLERKIDNLLSEIKADSLESYVTWLQDMGTRFCLADNRREVAVDIMNRLEGFGYNTVRLDSFFIERTWRDNDYAMWQYNVVAVLAGTGQGDEVTVIGGHYDDITTAGDPFSIAPGAHDNASGVAAMMEIARIMKKEDYTPATTIEFVAFGAEELGLYGSFDFASRLSASGTKVKMMLNNDMIAYEPSLDNTGWMVNIINYPTSVELLEESREICLDYTVLNNFTDNTHSGQSDSYPFAEYGFPALFFASASLDPFYHTPDDVVTNLNFEYCREITALCCAIIVKLD